MGPLVVFFITNQRADLFTATGIFMAAVVASLAVSYALTRHLPIMPLVSAGVVVIFGGLTLWLHDETFIVAANGTIIYRHVGALTAAATAGPIQNAIEKAVALR